MITGKIDEPVKVRDYSDQNFTPDDEKDFEVKTLREERLIDTVPELDELFEFDERHLLVLGELAGGDSIDLLILVLNSQAVRVRSRSILDRIITLTGLRNIRFDVIRTIGDGLRSGRSKGRGDHAKHHSQCKHDRKSLFHCGFPLSKFFGTKPCESCTIIAQIRKIVKHLSQHLLQF